MAGGVRLLIAFSFLLLFAAAMVAGDNSQSSSSTSSTSSSLPNTAVKPVIDMFHGTKVVDNYRWLEDGKSPATQKWVEEEMAYTRGVLDRLAGREAIHQRLTQLLSIGSVTPPMIAGRHYFYTKREGMQNQPILYVREGLNGEDRVLCMNTKDGRTIWHRDLVKDFGGTLPRWGFAESVLVDGPW